MEEHWNALLQQAVRALSQACERLPEAISHGEAGVKDIRELTAALKELNALHRSLHEDGEEESPLVEVSFDGDGEGWSR